jgi:hypothetical protein
MEDETKFELGDYVKIVKYMDGRINECGEVIRLIDNRRATLGLRLDNGATWNVYPDRLELVHKKYDFEVI